VRYNPMRFSLIAGTRSSQRESTDRRASWPPTKNSANGAGGGGGRKELWLSCFGRFMAGVVPIHKATCSSHLLDLGRSQRGLWPLPCQPSRNHGTL